jgi:hypothetical protein
MTHPTPLGEKIAAIESLILALELSPPPDNPLWRIELQSSVTRARDALTALAQDVAAMEEALGKLPRTRDGVVVVPGTRVWYVREGLEPEAHVIRGYEYESSTVIAPDGYANGCVFFSPSGSTSIWRWDQCYSTRDAALAAAAKGQGTVRT